MKLLSKRYYGLRELILLNNQERRLATVAAPKENRAIIASRGKTPSNQLPWILETGKS